jgi:hypothetical protein
MNLYLVVFDRSKGAVIRKQSYAGRRKALEARFAAEREFGDDLDIEVVVLGGDSWEGLKRTHARYFKGLDQLTSAASADVRLAST